MDASKQDELQRAMRDAERCMISIEIERARGDSRGMLFALCAAVESLRQAVALLAPEAPEAPEAPDNE